MAILNFRASRKDDILPSLSEAKEIIRRFIAGNDYDLQNMAARGWELVDQYYKVKEADELMAQADADYDAALYQKAFSLYDEVEDGDAGAAFGKGLCYFYGNGVECDREKAFDAFEDAASFGSAKAYVALSECYYEGEGTGKDMNKSVIFAFKALELDAFNEDALEILNKCTNQPFEDCDEALTYWQNQLISTPESPLEDVAFAHYLKEEYDEAIAKGIQGVRAGELRNSPVVIAQAIIDKYGDDDKLHLNEAHRWILLSLQNGGIDEAKLYTFLLSDLACWAWNDDTRENDPELADLLNDATNIVSDDAIVFSNDKSFGYYVLGLSLYGSSDKELGENLITVSSDLGYEGATEWLNESDDSDTEEEDDDEDTPDLSSLSVDEVIQMANELEDEHQQYVEAGWYYLKAIGKNEIPRGENCLLVARFLHRWINDANYPAYYNEDKELLEAITFDYLKFALMDTTRISRSHADELYCMLAIYVSDGVGCYRDKNSGMKWMEIATMGGKTPSFNHMGMSKMPDRSINDDISDLISVEQYDDIIHGAIRSHLAAFKRFSGDTAERISYLSHICNTYDI